MLRHRKHAVGEIHTLLLMGYDDIASINYFGRILPAYYQRKGKTITQALREFMTAAMRSWSVARHLMKRCWPRPAARAARIMP